MAKKKLLIECVFKNKKIINCFKYSSNPIQNKPFSIGLRIRNIDSKEFPGGKISNLDISSVEGKTIHQPFEEEFSIRNLNPNECCELWVPYNFSTFLSGLVWISCQISPLNSNDEIETYQKDCNSNNTRKYSINNKWGNESYIFGKLEYEQSRTNNLICIFTVLTALQGIFGLNNILKIFFQFLSSTFLGLSNLITNFIK